MLHLISEIDISKLGETGLIAFLAIFVAVVVWALSRTRHDIRHWAELPIEHDTDVRIEERHERPINH